MKKDIHHNDKVGKKRPDGKVYRLIHDKDCRKMLTAWLKGEKMRDLIAAYKLTRVNFGHQKYYHIKRLCGPFMEEVVRTFKDGGTNALMRRFDLDVYKANKLYQRSDFYLKHRRNGIDKVDLDKILSE